MTLLRRTWFVTVLFVVVSTAIWWTLIDASFALRQLLPTVLVTPLVWWAIAGHRAKPGLVRGIVGGALAGFVAQGVEYVPTLWRMHVNRENVRGEDGLAVAAAAVAYLMIGVCATVIGALLGLVSVIVQRRMNGRDRPRLPVR